MVISNLDSIFSMQPSLGIIDISAAQPGMIVNQLNDLVTLGQRAKDVSENKLWDYVQVELDPNFNRSSSSGLFENLLSKSSIATQVLTAANANLQLSKVSEFFPSNMMSLLNTMTSLSSTINNSLSYFDSNSAINLFERFFEADLKLQITNDIIDFSDLLSIFDNTNSNFRSRNIPRNTGLSSILDSTVNSLLPASIESTLDSSNWIEESPNQEYTELVRTDIRQYNKNKIKTLSLENDYTNIEYNFTNLLGITQRDNLIREVDSDFETFLNINLVKPGFNITNDKKDKLKNILLNSFKAQTIKITKSSVGLPSVIEITRALDNLSFNIVAEGFRRSISSVIQDVINDIDVAPVPSTQEPFDYLFNVKRNIEARQNFDKVGFSNDKYEENTKYLQSVILSKDLSSENLAAVLDNINKGLNVVDG